MSKFFDDTMQGLLEAVEIAERTGMLAPTLYVSDNDIELINCLAEIRKKENVS